MSIHHYITKFFKYLCVISFFTVGFSITTAQAQFIDTETLVDSTQSTRLRDHVKDALNREEVKTKMQQLGVATETIQARVDSLSNAEVQALADDIDALPAGGAVDNVTLLLIIIIIILLV